MFRLSSIRESFFGRLVAYCCVLVMAIPGVALAQVDLPRPTDRWIKKGDSYIKNLGSTRLVDPRGMLPKIKDGDIQSALISGDAKIVTTEQGRVLVVDQGSTRILLDWDSFNIGSDREVQFVQPDQSSVAVNRIFDQSPSNIFGSLKSNGSVWLVNPNGIFFGKDAQVDVRGLVAAAMDINGLELDRAKSEVKTQFESIGLFDSIKDSEPLLVNAKDLSSDGSDLPRVLVARGAHVNSDGAPVLMAAPEVINEGIINSDGGQVVLAASRKDVYLALTNTDPERGDKDYRGYLVEVDSGDREERGAVVNAGEITSYLGNVTLIAGEIIQAGNIRSSTAVDTNGSIRLLARDQATPLPNDQTVLDALYLDNVNEAPELDRIAVGREGGRLFIKPGSVTEILLGIESSDRRKDGQYDLKESSKLATDSLEQRQSKIALEGEYVELGEESSIIAKSGEVSIRARTRANAGLYSPSGELIADSTNDGQLVIGRDVLIDVSGAEDVEIDSSRNVVEVYVTSNEVADTPDQKGGELLSKRVLVDVQKGTELFDWKSSLANIERSVEERSIDSGTVDLLASGKVTVDDTAKIDISGGWLNYEAGYISTSRVISRGEIVDISDADATDPNVVLLSDTFLINDQKWGERPSYRQSTFLSRYHRDAYQEGGSGGVLSVTAPTIANAHNLGINAEAKVGKYQAINRKLPNGGQVTFDLRDSGEVRTNVQIVKLLEDLGDEISKEEVLLLVDQIESTGASNLSIATNGDVSLQENSALTLVEGSGLEISAGNIVIDSDIRIVGGDVRLNQVQVVRDDNQPGGLYVNSTIDVSGNWTNHNPKLLSENDIRSVAYVDGGEVELSAYENLILSSGAGLIANSGAWFQEKGSLKIGDAGSISISSDFANNSDNGINLNPASIALNGTIQAIDGADGGVLAVSARNITITANDSSDLSTDMVVGRDLFEQAQVGSWEFNAVGGDLIVSSGADIRPSAKSFVEPRDVDQIRSSDTVLGVFAVEELPVELQQGGDFSLSAERIDSSNRESGRISIEKGANLAMLPGGEISLNSNTNIAIDGRITSPGGRIDVVLNQASPQSVTTGDDYIFLGKSADLDVSSKFIDVPSDELRIKNVKAIDAGSINLAANAGSVIINDGAKLSLRGKNKEVKSWVGNKIENISIGANSGELQISAEQSLLLSGDIDFGDNSLAGRGGVLSISLTDEYITQDTNIIFPEYDLTLKVGAQGSIDEFGKFQLGETINDEVLGSGFVSSDWLVADNLASLTLDVNNQHSENHVYGISVFENNKIRAGTVVLDTTDLNIGEGDLSIEAIHVRLGESFENQKPPVIEQGEGDLSIVANFVSLVGNFVANAAKSVSISAADGVRGDSRWALEISESGSLERVLQGANFETPGDLSIDTPAIYVSPLTRLALNVSSESGSISTTNTSDRDVEPILSYGGVIELSATDISIDNSILAPSGAINIKASDSVTLGSNSLLSVSSEGIDVSLGRVVGGGVNWVYPFSSARSIDVEGLALEKSIRIQGQEIVAEAGSEQNLSSGGRIYGREFVAGLGGNVDILAPENSGGTFAIVPGQHNGFGVMDLVESNASGIQTGTVINIKGADGIADGSYTVLPASYALLPGAYLVSPGEPGDVVEAGFSKKLDNGAQLVSGHLSGPGADGSNWIAMQLESAEQVKKKARYDLVDGNNFLKASAPGVRSEDNGRLVFDVGSRLDYRGMVTSSEGDGASSAVDISSEGKVVISSDAIATDSAVHITPGLFESLGAGSVLVGGERVWNEDLEAWTVDTRVSDLEVSGNATEILANELFLSATNQIRITSGASIRSAEKSDQGGRVWQKSSDAANLMMSASSDSVLLNGSGGSSGDIVLSEDVVVEVNNVASSYSEFNGFKSIKAVEGNNLTLYSNRIDVGAGGVGESLLRTADTIQLGADIISFNNDVSANADDIRLTASRIDVAENAEASINARNSLAINVPSSEGELEVTTSVGSMLSISSEKVIFDGLGENKNRLSVNADQFVVNASEQVVAYGGVEIGAGNIEIDTPLLTGGGETDLSLSAVDKLELVGGGNSDDFRSSNSGSAYRLSGREVVIDTHIDAKSGLISAVAYGGGLSIGENALMDVSGFSLQFPDRVISTDPGLISLRADGDIRIEDLASLALSNSENPVEGGSLIIASDSALTIGAGQSAESIRAASLDVMAQSIEQQDLTKLLALNNQGFDNQFSLVLTGSNEHLTIEKDVAISANKVRLATIDGDLELNGSVRAKGAKSTIDLYGRNISLGTDSVVEAAGENGELSVRAPEGQINISEAARISVNGDLSFVSSATTANSDVRLSDDDTVSGSIFWYLAKAYQTSAVDQSFLESAFSDAVSLVDSANLQDYGSFAGKAVKLRPWLDIFSSEALLVSDVSGVIDTSDLRTSAGEVGHLSLRSSGEMILDSSVSAGINLVENDWNFDLALYELSLLLPGESWSVGLSAGVDSQYLYEGVSAINSLADIKLSSERFVRTGTGDLSINAGGDLLLSEGSYIASLGRADYLTEDAPEYIDIGFGDFRILDISTGVRLAELPSWGDKSFLDLTYLTGDGGLEYFSGFSRDGGDVSIDARGDVINQSNYVGSSADFIYDLNNDFNIGYEGIRSTALAVDKIQGGIHAVGGGSIDLLSGGKLEKLNISSPSLRIDNNSDLADAGEVLVGGAIEITSFKNANSLVLQNDGSSLFLRSFGDIGRAEGFGASVLIGSDTDMELIASHRVELGGILNTTLVPGSSTANNQFGGTLTADDMVALYFDGYDSSSLSITAVSGDLYFGIDADGLTAQLGSDIAGKILEPSYQPFYTVTPSQLSMRSLGGSLDLRDNLTIFPSVNAGLELRAFENITYSQENGKKELYLYLPDHDESVVQSISNESVLALDDSWSFLRPENLTQNVSEDLLHGPKLLDRDSDALAVIHALNGDFGGVLGEDAVLIGIALSVPMPVDIYAGQDIVNVNIRSQHYEQNHVSQVRAGRDIIQPIATSGTQIFEGPGRIAVSGSGDLVVTAGRNIELGASAGIVSIGASENDQLPVYGSNLHVYAGFSGSDSFDELLGGGIDAGVKIPLFDAGSGTVVPSEWVLSAGDSMSEDEASAIIAAVSKASGVTYSDDIKAALPEAIDDFKEFDSVLANRVAVRALAELVTASPELVVDNGEFLFGTDQIDQQFGLASQDQRSIAFQQYWDFASSIIVLDKMLSANRSEDLIGALDSVSINDFSKQDVASQANSALLAAKNMDARKQLLVAESVMMAHVKQTGVEGGSAGNALVNFERGMVALQRFLGDSFSNTLALADQKVNRIQQGLDENLKEVGFGERQGKKLTSFSDVLEAWSADSGDQFILSESPEELGRISMTFSTIQSASGGDVNIIVPAGSVDVGLAASQLEALNIDKGPGELGVLTQAAGDINSVVGNAFNINESRTFGLGGGDINLWSTFGDIDAGKGAKTEIVTPETGYIIDPNNGSITSYNPPTVSGSGIRSTAGRSASSRELSKSERFNEQNQGAGGIYLATPLGIVDAGEAGITSAGNLFLAAQQVRGADNISVDGVSVGVPTTTSVGANVAGASSATNAASEAAQQSMADAAGGSGQKTTAFITIELLDMGN